MSARHGAKAVGVRTFNGCGRSSQRLTIAAATFTSPAATSSTTGVRSFSLSSPAAWSSSGRLRNSTRSSTSLLTTSARLRLTERCATPAVTRPVRHVSTIPAGEPEPAKTPLYDLHASYGAKFVPFGGYLMPVQYKDLSVSESHKWTREKASLFDVSHMVQHHFSGPGTAAFLSTITPSSINDLPEYTSTLSCLLHPDKPSEEWAAMYPSAVPGGIVDDTIITSLGSDFFYVVTNAGCRQKDLTYLNLELAKWRKGGQLDVNWKILEGQGLVALQGPLAHEILGPLVADPEDFNIQTLYFGQSKKLKLRLPDGTITSPLLVSRGGYTGEDGFEISIPAAESEKVTRGLLEQGGEDRLRLAGLGARDSLRLEAGMCLYGHDLDDSITPPEAALGWVVGKERRESGGGFYGASRILKELRKVSEGGGTARKRVGLLVEGAPAREDAIIARKEADGGAEVGKVTSGCPSPTLGKNIAMGYVLRELQKAGTELDVLVRGKRRPATVTKMPFVPTKYHKKT